MERVAIIKSTLNGNPNSLHYRSFAPKNTPKDPSFSTYLKPEPPKTGPGEDIVGGNIDDCDQISVFEAENYFNESTDQKEKMKQITKMDNNVSLESSIASSRLAYRVNSFHATPTASSEASWNSQTGLLTNPQGSAPISLRSLSNGSPKRGPKRANNWFLMRKCPCFGNKSVQVQEKPPNPASNPSIYETKKNTNPSYDSRKSQNPAVFEPKKNPNPIFDAKKNPIRRIDQAQPIEPQRSSFTSNEQKPDPNFTNFRRISSETQFPKSTHLRPSNNANGFQFSFPILNSQFPNAPNPNSLPLDDPPRESLEVFQPAPDPSSGAGRVRRNYPFSGGSPMSRIASTEDDVASDASSDLFEIESLSTNINTNTNTNTNTGPTNNNNTNSSSNSNNSTSLVFGSMGEEPVHFSKYRPSVDSECCYAPSEASVEWSVATADGFLERGNFSASVSQVDFGTKYSGAGESDTWHGLGCRGEKDVCVGRRVGKESGGAWGGGRDGFGYKGW